MKTIEEKNRMIAEFIGYDIGIEQICIDDLSDKQEAFCFDNIMTPQQRSSYMRGTKYFDIKNVFALQYHASWDWLMEVVKKIELSNKETGFMGIFTFHGLGRTIVNCYKKEQRVKTIDVLDQRYGISPTYQAVIQFIEWYNENK